MMPLLTSQMATGSAILDFAGFESCGPAVLTDVSCGRRHIDDPSHFHDASHRRVVPEIKSDLPAWPHLLRMIQ